MVLFNLSVAFGKNKHKNMAKKEKKYKCAQSEKKIYYIVSNYNYN